MRCLDVTARQAFEELDWEASRTALREAMADAQGVLAPPPKLTISEWADLNRVLGDASAQKGQWQTVPFQRAIMDCLTDPDVQEMVWAKSSQVGATEILLNILLYYIDYDPSPILLLEPNLKMAEGLSKDRLAQAIRSCPPLAGKVADPRARDSGNTILHKTFPGGQLTIVGAESSADLAMRPIRIVLCDEVDRYPKSAKKEGSPIRLAYRRANNFWNRKQVQVGTPVDLNDSNIWSSFLRSTQQYRYLPCPHCGEFQILEWRQVLWQKDDAGRDLPDTAIYACKHCGAAIDLDAELEEMDRAGKWIAHNPGSETIGFHINELYSPWRKLRETVKDFLDAKLEGREALKTWWNTALGLPWDPQQHVAVSTEGLVARREAYPAKVPWGVGCLTASVDTQDDRLEFKVKGWGRANESWLIHREVIHGSPTLRDVWAKLDTLRLEGYRHASGKMLFIEAMGVDTGGHFTKQAWDWARARIPQRVFPLKGASTHPHPLIKKSGSKKGLKLWFVGTITAKDEILLGRLRLEQAGPGYMHFPLADWCDEAYFKQLATSEERKRASSGKGVRWVPVEKGVRNEALDLEVYAWAVFSLLNVRPEEMDKRLAFLEAYRPPPEDTERQEQRPNTNNTDTLKQARKPRRRTLSKGRFEKS